MANINESVYAARITANDRKPVSPAQQQYLTNLLAKIVSEPVRTALQADLNSLYTARLLDTREASRQIDRLKAIVAAQVVAAAPAVVEAPAPVVEAPAAPVAPARLPFPVVSAGRYAVEIDGLVRWYNVTVKPSGRIEAKRYVSDSLVTIRLGEAVRALRLIEADEKGAALRFARESVRCYVCGRRLTDNDENGNNSVAKGIGPECEAKGLGY